MMKHIFHRVYFFVTSQVLSWPLYLFFLLQNVFDSSDFVTSISPIFTFVFHFTSYIKIIHILIQYIYIYYRHESCIVSAVSFFQTDHVHMYKNQFVTGLTTHFWRTIFFCVYVEIPQNMNNSIWFCIPIICYTIDFFEWCRVSIFWVTKWTTI